MNDDEKEEQDQDAAGQHDDNHENENESELTPEQKTQQEAENFILNFKDEDYDDPEMVKKLEDIQKNNKLLKTTIQQKNHWREKATANKPAPAAAPKKPAAPAKTNTNTEVDERYTGDSLTDFRLDHRELDKATVSEIVKYAKANDCTLDEAMKAEAIKIMVREKTKKEDVEDASINSNQNRKPASGIAAKDWTNATREEIEKERVRIMGQEG